MADAKSSSDDDLLKEARQAFAQCQDAEKDNRQSALDDIKFARDGEQWPSSIRKEREEEGRPCLTINKMPAFIRQVVNDARQNKPSIKVHPADSGADPETAEVMNGLIRNIEYTSNADVAYDTGTESAVSGGFGYWRVTLDYAYDDSFEMDLGIGRISNPFSVYGDPNSTAADSSDWDVAFVVDRLTFKQYEREYNSAEKVDWDSPGWTELKGTDWIDDKTVQVAEWWTREKVDRKVSQFLDMRDGQVYTYADDDIKQDEDLQLLIQNRILEYKQSRVTKSCKVKQRTMSGAAVLETVDWLGRYIPIVPVYGDEFDIEGKRYLRSLIHNGVDAQRMYNYWRTTSTETIALAPKAPFIGKKGAFNTDMARWNTANRKNHPFLQYDGDQPPIRLPLDPGAAAGAMSEALASMDDIKGTIGLYDASLGARSNETSGKAIMARQREGDVSTFHFIDNMARAIRHTGRILLDLIPKVYTTERVIRVIGEDGSASEKRINTQQPVQQQDKKGNAIMAMHDLAAGKYDLTVTTGPSFTTRREEAAMQMTEMIRAFPAAAPVVGPHLAKNLDWPGADEIAEELEKVKQGQVPDQVQKQMQDLAQKVKQLTEENQNLKMDQAAEQQKIEAQKQIDTMKVESSHNLKLMEIQSDEAIAIMKIEADERVNTKKADMAAVNQAALNRQRAQQRPSSGNA